MISIPAFLTTRLFAYAAGALGSAAVGIWLAGAVYYGPKLDKAALAYAELNAEYSQFQARIDRSTAVANAEAANEQMRLQRLLNASQEQLAAEQEKTHAKSEELRKILASAKPGDIRALGPSALAYYDRLRELQKGTAPGP